MDIHTFQNVPEQQYSLLCMRVPLLGRSWLRRSESHGQKTYFIVRGPIQLEGLHGIFEGPYAERPQMSDEPFTIHDRHLSLSRSILAGGSAYTGLSLEKRLSGLNKKFMDQYAQALYALEDR